MPLQLIHTCFVLDKLTEEERQQLLVVPGLRQIFTETLEALLVDGTKQERRWTYSL